MATLSTSLRGAVLAVSLGLGACAGSTTIAAKDRAAPAVADAPLAWHPARRDDVLGLLASERVTGEAAATLRRVWYVFEADGSYSGAALVLDGGHSVFQTLAGRWSLEDGVLRLDATSARAAAEPGGRVRFDSDGGSVVLARVGAE